MLNLDEARDKTVEGKIATALRFRRLQLSKSADDIGRVVGVSSQQIFKYEAGKAQLSIGRLQALADALDVPLNYFFADIHNQSDKTSNGDCEKGQIDLLISVFTSIDDAASRSNVIAMMKGVAGKV